MERYIFKILPSSDSVQLRYRPRTARSEFLGYISGALFARLVEDGMRVQVGRRSSYNNGQSCDRYQLAVLSARYTGRPSAVATRDLTQIGEPRSSRPVVGPGIRLVRAPCETDGRSFQRETLMTRGRFVQWCRVKRSWQAARER